MYMYMYFAYVYRRQFFRWQFSWGIFPGEQYSGGKYFRGNFHRGFFRDILSLYFVTHFLVQILEQDSQSLFLLTAGFSVEKNLALKNVQTNV